MSEAQSKGEKEGLGWGSAVGCLLGMCESWAHPPKFKTNKQNLSD